MGNGIFGGFMRNQNIVKLDSKGRILIPNHVRQELKSDEGTEFIFLNDTVDGIRIVPISKGNTTEIRLLLGNNARALSSLAEIFSDNNIDILISEGRVMRHRKSTEWDFIVDTTHFKGDSEKLRKILLAGNGIEKIEIIR